MSRGFRLPLSVLVLCLVSLWVANVQADTIDEFNRGRDRWRDLSKLPLGPSQTAEANAINNLWARYWAQMELPGGGAFLPQPLVNGVAAATLHSQGDVVVLSHTFFDASLLVGLFDPDILAFITALPLDSLLMGNEGILPGSYAAGQVENTAVMSVSYFWSDEPFDVTTPGPGDLIDPAKFLFIGISSDAASGFSVPFTVPTGELMSDVIDIMAIVHLEGGLELESVGFASIVVAAVPEPSALLLISVGLAGLVAWNRLQLRRWGPSVISRIRSCGVGS